MSAGKQSTTKLRQKLQQLHDQGLCSDEELANARLHLSEQDVSDETGKDPSIFDDLHPFIRGALIKFLGLVLGAVIALVSMYFLK